MAEIRKRHDIDLLNLGTEADALILQAKLKGEAEKAKHQLSVLSSVTISIPNAAIVEGKPFSIHLDLSREQFEGLILDLAESTLHEVRRALRDAGMTVDEVDEVLLVGGSTRIPLIRRLVEQEFGKPSRHDLNPDEAVAIGAAISAASKIRGIPADKMFVYTDVCPHSLGIEMIYGRYSKIIHRNSTIPRRETKRYYTVKDNQVVISICVHQGESERCKENILIESFDVQDVPPAPAGKESIDVTFMYDMNGLLQVNVLINSTGQNVSRKIKTKAGVMTTERVQEAVSRLEEVRQSPEWVRQARPLLTRAEQLSADLKDGSSRRQIEELITKLRTAIDQRNRLQAEQLEEELLDLLVDLMMT